MINQRDKIIEANRQAWNARALRRDRHTKSALEKDFKNPLPILDPENWFEELKLKKVICLGSGGGLQSALLAAAGAKVTVVDISEKMLDLDRQAARKYGFAIAAIQASIDDLSQLEEASFDFALQPVSSCYIPDIRKMYEQVYRVLAPGRLYVSQHKQPASLQAQAIPQQNGYLVTEPYYRVGPLPSTLADALHREADTTEFLHTWEELIGSLCQSGFVIEGLVEPRQPGLITEHGSFAHRSAYLPPYVKIKARKATANEAKSNILKLC